MLRTMITTTTTRLCICCGKVATRRALARPDRRGMRRAIYLCSRCPSPRQIDQEARAIADSWSELEMGTRIFCCPIGQVEAKRAVYYDRKVYHLVMDGE